MNDGPVLRTPGEVLLEAREKAGLTLDEVAERTKIPVPILHSLELDEYHKISGALYVNSFLRTYAVDVGVDPALVVDLYARFSGEVVAGSSEPDAPAVWTEDEVKIQHVGLPWGRIGLAAAAVVIVGLVVIWLSLRGGDEAASEAEAQPPARETLLAEEPAPTSIAPGAVADPAGDEDAGEIAPESRPETGRGNDAGSLEGASLAHLEPEETAGEDEPAADEAEPPAPDAVLPVEPAAIDLPAAVEGGPGLRFVDDERWPVVLRLLSAAPVDARVVRDAERIVSTAQWSSDVRAHPVLPADGIRPGQPYRTADGLVVYWGARDQFSLRLDRTSGVEVSLNGRIRNITGLRPGQEIILFVP